MQADIDGNGTLDCKEFVTVSIHLKKIRSEDHLPKVFSYFDKNGSGFIEMEELKEALSPRGDQKAIDDIIFDVDKDKVIRPPSIHHNSQARISKPFQQINTIAYPILISKFTALLGYGGQTKMNVCLCRTGR